MVVMLTVAFIAFMLFHYVGDPVTSLLGQDATQEQREALRKDLGLVLDEAKHNGARLPVTALVDQFYSDVQAMGGRRWDTSSLIKRLK